MSRLSPRQSLLAGILLAGVLLAGCASNPITDAYKARDRLFAPDPLNPPESEQIFVDTYNSALQKARTDSTRASITAYVDAGNALNAQHCQAWIRRDMAARRGLIASDKNIGVAAGLFTALAGIFEFSPVAVATTGAVQAALSGFGNARMEALGAPSVYQAQAAIRSLLAACSDQLTADAPKLTFGVAYGRLEACAATCSQEAAQSLADRALAGAITTQVLQAQGAGK